MMILAFAKALLGFAVLFTLAMCRSARNGDEAMEIALAQERAREETGL